MRSLKGFAAAAALLTVMSAAARAQVDDQTADEIRRGIKVWIGQNVQGMSGVQAIELDEQIAVIPDGSVYRVTLPAGRAIIQGGDTLHFGEIKADLTPRDDGWYDASWQLPDSYRIEPNYGSEIMIAIGGQAGQGVFAPEFQALMSLDGELRDIVVSEVGDDARLTIDRIGAIARSTEVSSGIYDTEANYRLDRLAFSDGSGREMFELSDLEVNGTADDARLADLVEFQRQSNALTAEINRTNDVDQIAAQIEGFAALMESMPTLLAGMSFEFRHGTVSVHDHGDLFTVSSGAFSMSMEGLDQDLSQLVIASNTDGIDANDPEIAKLIPREARFRLAVLDLPNDELVQLGIGTMRSMGTTDPAMAMLMASGGLQQALTTADSSLEIGPIRLASDIASIDLEGGLRPDAKSPYGAVGEIDMVATGLDALIVEIQNSGGDPEAVQFLTLLQTLGAQAPDADGRTVRTYAFRLDAAGTLLLNGSDIMPLISGMQ